MHDDPRTPFGLPAGPGGFDLEPDEELSTWEQVRRDWPRAKGMGLQPWDVRALGITVTPGEPVEMPVRPDHGRPVLTSGSGGPSVAELGRLLGKLGYENSVSRGQNPFSVLYPDLMAAVEQFRRDYDIAEDPTGFGGDNPAGQHEAQKHVGPWTWAAILRVADREGVREAA